MRIYVISLTRSYQRRARMREQLERAGCAYELFSAIDGADGRSYFAHRDDKRYLLNTGRVATDGEIGCYASHLYLWNACVALGEPIVILEDDAELDSRFNAALEAVERWVSERGFVRLQTWGPGRKPRMSPIAASSGFTLNYCRHYSYGAMAYAVAPVAAAAFVRSSRTLAAPVDHFIRQSWRHGQALYALSPPVVRGGELCNDSTITGRARTPLRPIVQAQRTLTKVGSSIARAFFNLRQWPWRETAATSSAKGVRFTLHAEKVSALVLGWLASDDETATRKVSLTLPDTPGTFSDALSGPLAGAGDSCSNREHSACSQRGSA